MDDIGRELETALNRLKREARQAEKYKKISAEIRALQAALLYVRWNDARIAAEAAALLDAPESVRPRPVEAVLAAEFVRKASALGTSFDHLPDRAAIPLAVNRYLDTHGLPPALALQPALLLLDEPLGALDALTRIEMQQLIERLWQQHGFTVLLVTHDVAEAVAVADRVILIEDGQIGLDLDVQLVRPRPHGSPLLAALEARVLDRVLAQPELPTPPDLVSPLPTQLRWAL